MAEYELDKWTVKDLYELWKKGRLNPAPDYQRSKVWTPNMKYDLIDTVLHDWPMGIVLLNVLPDVDADGDPIKKFDVVDGQQRLTTLFEYRDATEEWCSVAKAPSKYSEFRQFGHLSTAKQERFEGYKVAVALMKDFGVDEILDIFSRLQHSKPLVIGEKVKALRSDFKPAIHEVANHKIFNISAYRFRDAHWNFSSLFFKAVYRENPYDRQEYERVEDFLRHEAFDPERAKRVTEETRRILNYEYKVLEEMQEVAPNFREIGSARLLKWLFAALQTLLKNYALGGKESSVAQGVLDYYGARDSEGTDEWAAYLKTGRSGRIDTDDVRDCLEQLSNRIVAVSSAEPLDKTRGFTVLQRSEIFSRSGGSCAICHTAITPTNFHADHIKPHKSGGQTVVENGQALCSRCNRLKGGRSVLEPATA